MGVFSQTHVINNPNKPSVQQLNDNDEMKKGNPSQNQKSCKADTQANAICSTFAFAQPHPKPDNNLYI